MVGDRIHILPGRVETIGTAGVTTEGITRVLPPGQALVMVGFITTMILLIVDRSNTISLSRILQAAVLGLSVLLTFNRNFWVGIALALVLMGFLIPLTNKVKLLRILLAVLFGAIILIPAIASVNARFGKLIDASATRLFSLFTPGTLQEDSLQYRYIENSYAFPQIAAHPTIGMGLGTLYRPRDRRIDFGQGDDADKRRYIHNGHLWLMLRTGLIGYLFMAGMLVLFLKRGFQKWSGIEDPFLGGIVLSFSVTITGLLASALVSPIFATTYWAPVIATMLAVNEVIFTLDRKPALPSIEMAD
jgi:O-antigen ligase